MNNNDRQKPISVLFTKIRGALVENSAIAFSPDGKGGTTMTLWTGGTSRDNRVGHLSLVFEKEQNSRIKIRVHFTQQNLQTKKESTPISGIYYIDDPKLYERLNEAFERFGGQKPHQYIQVTP